MGPVRAGLLLRCAAGRQASVRGRLSRLVAGPVQAGHRSARRAAAPCVASAVPQRSLRPSCACQRCPSAAITSTATRTEAGPATRAELLCHSTKHEPEHACQVCLLHEHPRVQVWQGESPGVDGKVQGWVPQAALGSPFWVAWLQPPGDSQRRGFPRGFPCGHACEGTCCACWD